MNARGTPRLGAALPRLGAALRLAVLAGLGLLFLAGPPALADEAPASEAAAGSEAAPFEISDVPSGAGVLRGRVVHEARPDAVAGVAIALYALDPNGRPGSRNSETDAEGRFVFEGLSTEATVVYLVGARYAGLPFPGDRVVFEAGSTEQTIEVKLFEPSDDLASVRVVQSSVRVALGSGRLLVSEVHRLQNSGERVFHVPTERRAGRRAPLEAELFEGVENFAMPLGVVPEGATRDGRDFAFWGPLYPGEQEISFRYDIPIETGARTLVKRFPSAADRIRVFARDGGPLEAVAGMEPGEVVEESGMRFQPFEVTAPGAAFTTRLSLRVPEMRADPGALELVEGQIILEVDDVTLQAQEQYRLEVTGDSIVRAEPGELLLELRLPEAAEDIRFSADASALGLVRTEGGVGVVGPLQPGSHGLGLAYSLRSGEDGVRLARSFDRRLPLLRVLVADTGVAVATERLHRRRPQRDGARFYLTFETFELEAGESLALDLRALPPRGSSTRATRVLAMVVGVAALAFLLAPLGSKEGADPGLADDAEAPAARHERELLYESIRDLDHDYETGKIDEEGWQTLRAELRGRAVTLLAAERSDAEASAPPAKPTATLACPACGSEARPGDRFCSGCGAGLEGPPA
ncbi:MAG: zinc ribbon domain-containing protein [Deltaproteobacteria bacterium]|nr:zinc ribbon domain-containing protein [Deltaproteobacteria bacterium]